MSDIVLTSVNLHLAAIPVNPLYGDAAPQVLLEPAVERDALADVVDHWEQLKEGSEGRTTILRHAHLSFGKDRSGWSNLFRGSFFYLSSVDKLQKASAVLEGNIWQKQHLVSPVFLF